MCNIPRLYILSFQNPPCMRPNQKNKFNKTNPKRKSKKNRKFQKKKKKKKTCSISKKAKKAKRQKAKKPNQKNSKKAKKSLQKTKNQKQNCLLVPLLILSLIDFTLCILYISIKFKVKSNLYVYCFYFKLPIWKDTFYKFYTTVLHSSQNRKFRIFFIHSVLHIHIIRLLKD
jgi:hypothetical protein